MEGKKLIESVIKLGIKGSELVASRLKGIQDNKKKIEKKTDVNLNLPKATPSGSQPGNEPKQEPETGKDKPQKEEKKQDSEYTKNLKSEMSGAKSQAVSSINSFNGTGLAQAGIKGVGALAGPIGTMAAEALNGVVDAVVAFKEKMKQQAAIVADTGAKNNDIFNKLQGNNFSAISGKRQDINKT